jgi:hypothetical protein
MLLGTSNVVLPQDLHSDDTHLTSMGITDPKNESVDPSACELEYSNHIWLRITGDLAK